MNKFLIILHLTLMYSSVGSRTSKTKGNSDKNLQILSHRPTVEQHAIAFAKYHASSKVLNFLSKVHLINDICNRTKDQKIAFCEQSLRNDLFGFEFDFENYQDPICTDQTFDLAFIPDEALIRKVPMYLCPKIEFIDIETNRKTSLDYRFHVSRGVHRKTATMFLQKGFGNPIFPFYFVSRISFSKLQPNKTHRTPVPNNERLPSVQALKSTKNFLEAKQLGEPYQKFKLLFSSTSICSRRRSHKIHLCKHNLATLYTHVQLDTEGYDGNTCKKFTLNIKPSDGQGENEIKGQLSLLRCPITEDTQTGSYPAPFEVKKLSLYYIATDLVAGYVTLFVEQIGQNGELRAKFTQRIVTEQLLQQDILRTRFLPYPTEGERRSYRSHMASQSELESQIDNLASWPMAVERPSTIARKEEPWVWARIFAAREPQPYQNRWFMEHVLIRFSRIKAMKEVYQRFRKTYTSIDMCELSSHQRRVLCGYIIKSQDIEILDEFSPCIRQKITLLTRHIQVLESNNFSMWLCPTYPRESYYRKYLSKIHLRDSAILFRVYDADGSWEEPIIYPDILLAGIDRYGLAYKNDGHVSSDPDNHD